MAFQRGILGQWWAAYAAATNQTDRVRHFLSHLPPGLGSLGTLTLTWLTVGVGTAGLLAALIATRGLRGAGRAASLGLAGANMLLVLLQLFSLM